MKENISVSSLSSSYIIITGYNNKLAKYRTHPIILPKVSLQYTIISANDSCPHYLSFPPPSVVNADTPFINKLKNAIIFQFLDIIRLFFPYFVFFFSASPRYLFRGCPSPARGNCFSVTITIVCLALCYFYRSIRWRA